VKELTVDQAVAAAIALTNRGDFDQAESIHRQVIKLLPDSSAAWNNLGNLFRLQAKPDPACEAFENAIKVNPNFAPAHCNLGNALKDQGKIESAILAFRRAVELDPASAEIHSNLVYATSFGPDYDADQLLAEARAWADRFERPSQSISEAEARLCIDGFSQPCGGPKCASDSGTARSPAI